VGYRGTMNLIFEIANLMIERIAHHHAGDWPLTPEAQLATRRLDGGRDHLPPTQLAAASA
jgi:nitrogenase molybdenum-iron protein NifN